MPTPRPRVYKISISCGDASLKGKGASVYEALASIPKPAKITGKTFLTVSQGKRKAQQLYMPVAAKRLFFPIAQPIIAKKLETLLK